MSLLIYNLISIRPISPVNSTKFLKTCIQFLVQTYFGY